MRILIVGGVALAVLGTGSLAQEESCMSALESRAKAGEAVMDTLPRPDANCSELKAKLDAFVAADAALRKSHKSVRRACPSGEFVRGDSDGSARSQFMMEVFKKQLANCRESANK